MYMAHERRRYILRLLEQRKHIRSSALARELGVTDETIRTDLVALQQRGLLQRVHGGARYIPPMAHNPECATQRLDSQLAQLIIPHIPAHARVFLEPGVISMAIIAHLGEHPCSIVTNSPDIMRALAPPALPQELICTGGILNKQEKLLESVTARQSLQVDIAILCPHSISPGSIAYHSPLRALWAQAAAQSAARTILAAPSHHLNMQAQHSIPCTPHLLITEDNLPPEFHNMPVLTVPYISPDSFTAGDAFDY